MPYKASLTKKELLQLLHDVDDNDEIFIVNDREPLWLFATLVDVAVETDEGKEQILQKAVGITACSEEWFE